MNIHSLFDEKNIIEFASGDTKDIIEDLKDIQTQFNENVIKINEEFDVLKQLTDETKLAVQTLEQDVNSHITQFNMKIIDINEEFDILKQFHEQIKLAFQDVDQNIIKHGKKLNTLSFEATKVSEETALLKQDILQHEVILGRLDKNQIDIEENLGDLKDTVANIDQIQLREKINDEFLPLQSYLSRLGGWIFDELTSQGVDVPIDIKQSPMLWIE